MDIHVSEPSERRPWFTLVTSGMAERPMRTKVADHRFAELVMCLPPTWKLEQAASNRGLGNTRELEQQRVVRVRSLPQHCSRVPAHLA